MTNRSGPFVLAALAALLVAVVAMLPAFPLDETRYLTVAWEMRTRGAWILPTLNFAPYSHKPPLLFWLINGSWSVFGLSVWSARLVGIAATLGVIAAVQRLDRALAEDPMPGPSAAALMMAGLPLFVLLGMSIMFDMLLTLTVAAAMLALWAAGRSGSAASFASFGVCVGLGILTKGPVALIFTLPAVVLGPIWTSVDGPNAWYRRSGAALLLGAALALAWALGAAWLGGPAFAEALFWKQSAGRIAHSFAHARPFWFYVPMMLLFLAPLLIWRPAWAGLRAGLGRAGASRNFLLCWILPPTLVLTFISGKQVHYLLPVVPALCLLIALGLREATPRRLDRGPWLAATGALTAAAAALAVMQARGALGDAGTAGRIAAQVDLPLIVATCVAGLAAHVCGGRSIKGMLAGLAAANLMFLSLVAYSARQTIAPEFDLQPLADVVSRYRGSPIAVSAEPRGEIGFVARLEAPLLYVPKQELAAWLAAHPEGIAIHREKSAAPSHSLGLADAEVLYRADYRLQERISVVRWRRTASH